MAYFWEICHILGGMNHVVLKLKSLFFFFQLNLKYALHMQETEAKINNHEHNKCDQVAAIDRWLFVKQEEHDNLLLAEA